MDFKSYLFLVKSDLYRHAGNACLSAFLTHVLLTPGFKYSFWLRSAVFCSGKAILRYSLLGVARIMLRRYLYKFGIQVPYRTRVGSGFYIGHFGGIFVNANAVIGKNCNISQDVTIGQSNRGSRQGCPIIGDNVYIGPGAKIIGRVSIGNHVAIGANCVVSKDVPDNAVVVGIPCRIISYKGSGDYVNNTDYA